MEDVGGFYELATWRMYQRIQSARQDIAQDHFLPSNGDLDEGSRRTLQPRNCGGYIPSCNEDWAFSYETQAHVCEEEEEEDEEDPIFEMDL